MKMLRVKTQRIKLHVDEFDGSVITRSFQLFTSKFPRDPAFISDLCDLIEKYNGKPDGSIWRRSAKGYIEFTRSEIPNVEERT